MLQQGRWQQSRGTKVACTAFHGFGSAFSIPARFRRPLRACQSRHCLEPFRCREAGLTGIQAPRDLPFLHGVAAHQGGAAAPDPDALTLRLSTDSRGKEQQDGR